MAPLLGLYPNMLRICIKQAGYSFREVSRETAIPESTLYDWAAGNRSIPHHERQVLARLLGCSESHLQPQYDVDMLQLPQDKGLPSLKYWAAATYAEAESGRGNLKACQSALERADGVNTLTGPHPAWSRFEGSRLPALQGACYVRLKQPQLAEPALLEALQVLPPYAKSGRRLGMIFSDLATVTFQQKDIDQTCFYTDKVVGLVEQTSSGFLRDNLHKLRKQLAPFKHTAMVKQLDTRITAFTATK